MSSVPLRSRQRRRARFARGSVAVLLALGVSAAPAGAATPIGLGTAESFAVLAGSGITNTGATTITGDVGTFPTPSMTGFNTVVLAGVNHGGDAVTQQAKQDLTTAYNQAFASAPATSVVTELGGTTLTPGVYQSPTLGLNGRLTLDTLGDPHAVFVFQAGSTLITASASEVVVLGASSACNVFWQVGSSATLGSDSVLVGTVLAETSITANDGAVVEGRLLAQNGAVTLERNTITTRVCAAAGGGTPGPSTTTTTTTTATTADAAATQASDPVDPPATAVEVPTADATATATPATNAGSPPPGDAITTVTELPRTGVSDWLPLVGSVAIALGLLLVRVGTPRVPLRHSIRPRPLVSRSNP